MKALSTLLLFCVPFVLSAQDRYADIWLWEDPWAYHFDRTPPFVLVDTSSHLDAARSCISDPETGELLLYVERIGSYIRNARNNIVPGFQHPGPGGASMFIPFPDRSGRYYLVSQVDGTIAYWSIDARANSGEGQVLSGNDTLVDLDTSRLYVNHDKAYDVVYSPSDSSYILLVAFQAERGMVTVYSWKFFDHGVVPTARTDIPTANRTLRYLQASPNGRDILFVEGDSADRGFLRIGQLDHGSGSIGGILLLDTLGEHSLSFSDYWGGDDIFYDGVATAFSHSGCFLYLMKYNWIHENWMELWQYDLRDGNREREPFVIPLPEFKYVYPSGSSRWHYGSALRIAPDGTILVGRDGLIWNPDREGLAMGFQAPEIIRPDTLAISFGNGRNAFVSTFFYRPDACGTEPELTPRDTVYCGDSVTFTVPWFSSYRITHEWNFAGATPSASTDSSVTVHYSRPGTWSVLLTYESEFNSGERRIVSQVTVLSRGRFADAGEDREACRGDSVQLVGSGGDLRRWIAPDGSACTDCDTLSFALLEEGEYILEAIDSAGCIDYDTVRLGILPDPYVDPGRDLEICRGGSVRVAAHSGSADPTLMYRWSPSAGLDCDTCFAPNASPDSSTLYRVTATNRSGCSATDSIRLSIRPAIAIAITPDTSLCAGDSITLSVGGGTTYRWLDDPTLSCTDCPDPVARPVTTTTYTVEVTDRNGCVDSASVRIGIASGGALEVSGDTLICGGGMALLSVSGADRYRWFPAEGLDCDTCDVTEARPSQTTTYIVIGEGRDGNCPRIDSVTVVVGDMPRDAAGADTVVCAGTRVMLGDPTISPASGYRASWSPPDLFDDPTLLHPEVTVTEQMTFVLTLYDTETGCVSIDSVRVSPLVLPPADAGPDLVLCPGQSGILGGRTQGIDPDSFEYTWRPTTGLDNPNVLEPTASPLETTTYVIEVRYRGGGCVGYDTVEVVVEDAEPIRTHISRDLHAASGEPQVVELLSDQIDAGSGITELLLEMSWNGEVLIVEASSLAELLTGRLLEGWEVEIRDSTRQSLTVALRAPVGKVLSGNGALLGVRAILFLGEIPGSELTYRLSSPQRCPTFLNEPGYIRLDTICGLDLRLIETSALRYAPPRATPNPAGEQMEIEFGIGREGDVRMEVFDVSGRQVGTLVSNRLTAGTYRVVWDTRAAGEGTYWLRIASGPWSETVQVRVAQ